MSLSWQNNIPTSSEYDDVYFSVENGLAESEYVFLNGNHLPNRWHQQKEWVIGETGFGTGLNFFMTWHHLPPDTALTFISMEEAPLSFTQIRHALTPWSIIAPYISQLSSLYPCVFMSQQCYTIKPNPRVTLKLYIGQAKHSIKNMTTKADAWYLDGFAPSKNPDMWDEELLNNIASLTKPKGTFATFTASRKVHDRLANAGYRITKEPGFGKKREMLTGVLDV